MLTLGTFKYAEVMAKDGGPIAHLVGAPCTIRGKLSYQANATLRPELSRAPKLSLYSRAEGSGTHKSPVLARHIAISEALERWAFFATVDGPNRARHGFDADPSSTGMAAFPGSETQARKRAYLEAIERYCVRNWWEGNLSGTLMETDWPGVRAVVLQGPAGGFAVITFCVTPQGQYAYGHAADESLGGAVERAIVEMSRHERVIRHWHETGGKEPQDRWERRALFFSTNAGFESFCHRLDTPCEGTAPKFEVVADEEIRGPWSQFATVWRVAAKPPSERFFTDSDGYFFW